MNRIYIDCKNGIDAVGFLSALLDLYEDKEDFIKTINNLGIEDLEFLIEDINVNNIKVKHIKKNIEDTFNEYDIPADSLYAYEIGYDNYLKQRSNKNNAIDDDINNEGSNEINEMPLDSLYAYEVGYDDYLRGRSNYQNKEKEQEENIEQFPLDSLCAYEIGYDDYLRERIKQHEEKHHNGINFKDISKIIDNSNIDTKVKENAKGVFSLLTKEKSKVQGIEFDEVFYNKDDILIDIIYICGICYLLDNLKINKIVSSNINVGYLDKENQDSYIIDYILSSLPIYLKGKQKNIITPLGATLIKYFSEDFSDEINMTYKKIGYGTGEDKQNIISIYMGSEKNIKSQDKVVVLNFSVTEMNTYELNYVLEKILKKGALDAYTIPINKINGSGFLMSVILKPQDEEDIVKTIFKYTKTNNISREEKEIYSLDTKVENVYTKYGNVRFNISKGFGISRVSPEYEDLKRIADEENIPTSRY